MLEWHRPPKKVTLRLQGPQEADALTIAFVRRWSVVLALALLPNVVIAPRMLTINLHSTQTNTRNV